jgi:hypothetical protein
MNTADNTVESYVGPDAAAAFLSTTRRRILDLARQGKIPAHPICHGKRNEWRFRLSELATHMGTRAE